MKKNRVMLPKRFNEADIKRWKKVAKIENRNLTNWMETELNKAADIMLDSEQGVQGSDTTKAQ